LKKKEYNLEKKHLDPDTSEIPKKKRGKKVVTTKRNGIFA